jgi:hypothetical protein
MSSLSHTGTLDTVGSPADYDCTCTKTLVALYDLALPIPPPPRKRIAIMFYGRVIHLNVPRICDMCRALPRLSPSRTSSSHRCAAIHRLIPDPLMSLLLLHYLSYHMISIYMCLFYYCIGPHLLSRIKPNLFIVPYDIHPHVCVHATCQVTHTHTCTRVSHTHARTHARARAHTLAQMN